MPPRSPALSSPSPPALPHSGLDLAGEGKRLGVSRVRRLIKRVFSLGNIQEATENTTGTTTLKATASSSSSTIGGRNHDIFYQPVATHTPPQTPSPSRPPNRLRLRVPRAPTPSSSQRLKLHNGQSGAQRTRSRISHSFRDSLRRISRSFSPLKGKAITTAYPDDPADTYSAGYSPQRDVEAENPFFEPPQPQNSSPTLPPSPTPPVPPLPPEHLLGFLYPPTTRYGNPQFKMADQEEDFSSLPITDRFTHKIWKVRKQAYEDAAAQFSKTANDHDPAFKPFLQDSGLMKGAVMDSNVAAQQDGIAALVAFLKFGGRDQCLRTRAHTVSGLIEKGLSSTRAATKTSSLEAILLYCEIDVPGPVIEEILPVLSHKQPKVIAAAVNALTQIYHNFGCKIADPKPVLKILPKPFGHADKNVRAEATKLAVEFYRWLREAMKPMFWGDLKPTQQSDLEKQFEAIKAEAPAKQERLLRSQQEAQAAAPAGGGGEDEVDDAGEGEEEAGEINAFDLAEPQDVLKGLSDSFYDNMSSSKWKDRKEALEELFALLNVPRIKDGDFHELTRVLAKSMKDANIACVTQAAQCIEALAKGLRKGFAKYRNTVQAPIMERLKEKKVAVAEALGAALNQVFAATSLTDCLEDITSFLGHKNPQVKEGTMKFLIHCLRTTREFPAKQEITTIVEGSKKLLSEGSEALRSGGAEVLGTVMKIVGERAMNPLIDGLDDIRKAKIKEFYDKAEVKAKPPKAKPAPPPAAARAPTGGPKKMVRKGPPGTRKAAPAPAPPPAPEPAAAPMAPQPTSRAGAGSRLGKPGLKPPGMRKLGGPGAVASPRRPVAAREPSPPVEDEPIVSPPRPRIGMGKGGLAARSLAKPAAQLAPQPAASPTPSSGLSAIERAELDELRAVNERYQKQLEDVRHERSKLLSEIQELKNQNASLIEDHTRDVLSIKAKETQLVRARSDCEASEQVNERLRREMERLKRALNRQELGIQSGMASPVGVASPTHDDTGIYRDNNAYGSSGRNRMSFTSTVSEEKENGGGEPYPRSKLHSPELRAGGSYAGSTSSGRGSPIARGYRNVEDQPEPRSQIPSFGGGRQPAGGAESWKRAAEVTSQLKARIEQMKAKQGFSRQ
ncbi:hypothetical protein MKZ38_008272 [Zalerion maritima]|uniref:TOG domain-containing protein n=1 Tax=Zalerion maritima TaxID=339359 RepID=A0AAD5WV80_9PEZI|nr:hypothetical protein MKZ38_008272 [Zalerion maritima]